jgi:hypothetical protein
MIRVVLGSILLAVGGIAFVMGLDGGLSLSLLGLIVLLIGIPVLRSGLAHLRRAQDRRDRRRLAELRAAAGYPPLPREERAEPRPAAHAPSITAKQMTVAIVTSVAASVIAAALVKVLDLT